MLTASLLKVRAFKCYREQTVLELRDLLYGIHARDASDERRSNYLGKSSLPHALDYCLTGRLPPDARLKTDWISRGENSGEVETVLSDGTRVVRSLTRKDSEKLWCFPQGDSKGAFQGEAQTEIDRILGLTREDSGTWNFRQGEIAGMLRMDPGERLAMFSNWLRLGQLEECQGVAAATRGEIEKQLEEKRRNRDVILESMRYARERAGIDPDVGEIWLEDEIRRETESLAELREKSRERDAREAGAREREELAFDAQCYDRTVEEGKRLAEEARGDQNTPDTYRVLVEQHTRVLSERKAEEAVAENAYRTHASAARGSFSGVCPVVSERCPSAAFVSETAVRNRVRVEALERDLREKVDATERTRTDLQSVTARARAQADRVTRLESLRAAARVLKPKRDRWAALSGETVPLMEQADLDQALHHTEQRLASLQNAKTNLAEMAAGVEALERAIADLEKLAEVPSAAAMVFERARKQVAEGSLAEVEALANEVLTTLGTDLSVAVTWGRETGGLADNCGKCGAAFPASRKVRHCGKCGEERGQKVSEKLDVTPSRRSGAADDFGGLALALGASRWLREDRGSPWGLAVLDEPTAQMDASLRRSFAAKLPEVLARAGFAQGLVVSHHRDTLETLPGRIEVVSRDGWSTARVVQ